MNVTDFFAESLSRNFDFLKMELNDFSDADMLVRPCPGANHAAWQIGHLIVAETNLINASKTTPMPELPAGFKEKFTKDTSRSDDASAFPKKAELMSLFDKTRQATVNWARSLKEEELEKPMPDNLKGFAANVCALAAMTPVHVAMHIGQIQVIRRKLGKPVLF